MHQIPDAVQETIRFFQLLFKSSEEETREILSEEVEDMMYSGKNIFTLDEAKEILGKVEVSIKQVTLEENEKVSKLVGSLCMELMGQAQQQGANILPKPMELEDETVIKMFKQGQQQSHGMGKITDKTLLSNEQKVAELEKQLQERDAEIAKLSALLQERVDEAPQFINLKKMLKNKEDELEQLREELEKR